MTYLSKHGYIHIKNINSGLYGILCHYLELIALNPEKEYLYQWTIDNAVYRVS